MALHSISICSGVEGLGLGVEAALEFIYGRPHVPLLYIEREVYAASVLASRMEEGCLSAAPIWSDLATALGPECGPYLAGAKPELIFGGIPCQPWSVAGNQRGTSDERDLWPHVRELVVELAPYAVFLENVPGFAVRDGLGRVSEDLRDLGYEVAAILLSASDVGASHGRERLFILAHASRSRGHRSYGEVGRRRGVCQSCEQLDDADGSRRNCPGKRSKALRKSREPLPCDGCQEMGDTQGDDERRHPVAGSHRKGLEAGRSSRGLVHAGRSKRRPRRSGPGGEQGDDGQGQAPSRAYESDASMADSEDRRRTAQHKADPIAGSRKTRTLFGGRSLPLFAPGPESEHWPLILAMAPELAPALPRDSVLSELKEGIEPQFRGLASRLAAAMELRGHRLRAIGNGVCPLQAAVAYIVLHAALRNSDADAHAWRYENHARQLTQALTTKPEGE